MKQHKPNQTCQQVIQMSLGCFHAECIFSTCFDGPESVVKKSYALVFFSSDLMDLKMLAHYGTRAIVKHVNCKHLWEAEAVSEDDITADPLYGGMQPR